MADLELDEIHRLLSVPADTQPGHVSRRRFLQGAVAAGTLAASPVWFDRLAAAATPVGATEGILIVIHLGGGNDGLNTVVPIGDAAYRTLRGGLAIASPLPLSPTFGFHPALAGLKSRFAAGKVAIVHGVGQSTVTDLSHFSSTASWMAGTAGPSRTTGWLGRWLDGVSESELGLRAVTVGSSVPLHLVGQKSLVTALDLGGDLFGSDRSEPWMTSVYDAVTGYGSGPTGKGAWADRLASAGSSSVRLADDLHPVFTPELPDDSVASQLTLVARLINANLGIRVFNVALGSFDTHDNQAYRQQQLLADLDAGITAFYAALGSTWNKRVSMMTFSEFGRRPGANASNGTDHGTSSALMVIGDNVKGGFYAEPPKLTALDSRGDPTVSVDYRSVYGSVLTGWLGGDAAALLGASYPDLGLFKAKPGGSVTPPVTTGPWVPFATPSDLVRQQYLDFYGRVGDADGVTYWTGQLTGAKRTIAGVIDAFLHSTEFGRSVAPVARLALAGLGTTPAFDDLMAWAALVKAGTPLATVAATVCARPEFTSVYGSSTPAAFVAAIFPAVLGRTPTSTEKTDLVAKLTAATLTRPALVADLVNRSEAVTRYQARVEVLMTYAGLLRRRPDASGWTYWVGKVQGGTSIQRLIAQFFASAEYRRRFAG
ncbi:DUF1501 domain-containing protein [Aquihabitans sp. McL0605]|uniref:DUF1501 domain-containing protein n=1 Tax=Aquihabitans sp. McL0605 TaxID=3415671 RepID=UPI003CFB79F7